MASVEIPGKPPRWGNESINFYEGSFMQRPGSASPLKSYRCYGHFYTNSGNLHVGAKVFNQRQSLDKYGTASAYKLRMEDQRLPRPLATGDVHNHKLQDNTTVNLYQSHQHHYSQFSMPKPRPHSAGPTVARLTNPPAPFTGLNTVPVVPAGSTAVSGSNNATLSSPTGLYDSLSKSFYVTSYQKQISAPAANKGISRSRSMPLSIPHGSNPSSLTSIMVKPSTVPIRPLSASSRPQGFSSKGDFLKEVASKFPSPLPQPLNNKTQRPSSATLLRRGSIPQLRH